MVWKFFHEKQQIFFVLPKPYTKLPDLEVGLSIEQASTKVTAIEKGEDMPYPQEIIDLGEKVKNWGRWGEDDDLGTVNFITDEGVTLENFFSDYKNQTNHILHLRIHHDI